MSEARLKPFSLPVEMADYLAARNTSPSEPFQSLIAIADDMPDGGMRLGIEAGTFLHILTRAVRPSFVVEVGTFIGYSSLSMATALTGDARMLCCDVSEKWTAVARRHWESAGVADRINLVIGPGLHTLQGLPPEPKIDLAFVDADKTNYINYYEELVGRLSPHGLLLVDNTMWSARVLDHDDTSENTEAIRAFNDHVAADPRTTNVTLPLGDGLTMVSLAS
jgi:caffeoyl-CoA O-methyltransferase